MTRTHNQWIANGWQAIETAPTPADIAAATALVDTDMARGRDPEWLAPRRAGFIADIAKAFAMKRQHRDAMSGQHQQSNVGRRAA